MNFRNRSHIISPAAAFTLHVKDANVPGILWQGSQATLAMRSVGEGVETGWRASLVDEGIVRLSSKGESDRITQRSAVQIRPTAEMRWRSPSSISPR